MSILKNTRYRLGCTDNVEPADHKLRESDVLLRRVLSEASRELQTVIYLDPRAFTRHCVGWWLQSSLRGFHVSILPDPKQIVIATNINHIRAVIINAGPAPSSSPSVVRSISRVTQLLPDAPIILLSNHEDAEHIQKAFEIGVRGYVPLACRRWWPSRQFGWSAPGDLRPGLHPGVVFARSRGRGRHAFDR
jgi:PleD family two-component response regulator